MGMAYPERQMIQQQILEKAYSNFSSEKHEIPKPAKSVKLNKVSKSELQTTVGVPDPDVFDQIYVGLRTVVPGWMMGTFILIGAITLGIAVFKKHIKSLVIMWGRMLDK